MALTSAPHLFDINGKKVYQFKLVNKHNTAVIITNYGAIISSFIVKNKDGSANDIVLGFADPASYREEKYFSNYPYFGAAIGRYAGRIKNAEITIDGQRYQLQRNMGTDNLHGGIEGFDKKVWDVTHFDKMKNILELTLTSEDGEEKFPGKVDVTLRYTLNDNNELSYEYTAITNKPTAINLGHHSYFNLNNGKGDIRNHFIKINASKILEQGDNLTTTGNFLNIENTKHDFRNPHRIGERLLPGEGYDQSFVADKNIPADIPGAEAWSDESNIRLQVFTDQPIIHLYTGDGISPIEGKNGITYNAFSGFCLETQVHANAINIQNFPNTILCPGETYRHKTTYRIVHV